MLLKMDETSVATPLARISFEGFQINQVQLAQTKGNGAEPPKYRVHFKPSGRVSWGQGRFELRLQVTVESAQNTLSVEVDATSHFVFDVAVPAEDLTNLFAHNSLALTFPYIRSYLSALTALSGISTVTMPTFNLTSYAKTLRENIDEVEQL